jgi:D-cysteine desulfhydrase
VKGVRALDPRDFNRKICAAFRPRRLGNWPTPLEPHPVLAARTGVPELWVKREDRSSPLYGGNKVRGLEFLFSDVRPGDAVMTIGGWGSTHCLATVRHARALGARGVVAQFPQGSNANAVDTARAIGTGASACYRARTWPGFPFAWLRAWIAAGRLGPRRYIPGGGAAPVAVLGHALAALELAAQLPDRPDAIITPLGSGGTAAGLVLGCGLLGWETRVFAVQVAPRVVANAARVRRLASSARRLLLEQGIPFPHVPRSPELMVIPGMGRGYGYPTPEGEAARAWAEASGLRVDWTYGGKTLAALPALVGKSGKRIVFWHTYAAPGGMG